MSDLSREISVTEPVSLAFERVKLMLFQPFDLAKWFAIGFCAWLAGLGESGGGFPGGFHGNFPVGNDSQPNFHESMARALNYLSQNLYWIVPVAVAALVIFFALGMLVLWLNSRGKFLFLHCVALNKAEVGVPWQKFAREGNSLFWFRFVVGLAGALICLPLVGTIAIIIVRMVHRGEPNVGGILLACGLVLVLFVLGVCLALIQKFTVDFVVPIMFLRGAKCSAAWREFSGLLTAHVGYFALYVLFQILLKMVIGMIVFVIVIVTCCCAGCFMALPYLGTVLLLPVLIFKRAYSVYFLTQFGAAYGVFPPAPPAGLQPLTPPSPSI
jgi:hypothetical protein